MRAWQGIAGTVAGVTAASIAAGVAVERYALHRLRGQLDQEAVQGFYGTYGRCRTVSADDGVPLHVEVDGADGAELTVVFCHGWSLEHASWHCQRRELGGLGWLVFWDHRGHGRSGRGSKERSTIDQLGKDLRAVLDAVAPRGPLVLVGHSMGGMTLMALADRYPEYFAERVAGAALISTAAGGLGEAMPGLYGTVLRRALPATLNTLGKVGRPVERVRGMSRMVSHISTQRLGFGSDDVAPELVAFVDEMISATPVDVIAEFFPAILGHDRQAALQAFRRIPTLVVAGTADRLVPVEASRAIAEVVAEAELVEAPASGHMVMLGQAPLVNDALRALVERVRTRLPAGQAP